MTQINIGIMDYGLGNLYNVQRAFHYLGVNATISGSPDELLAMDKIVLPGVGAFGEGMKNLSKNGLNEALMELSKQGKSILGICLGMQLLLTESEEYGLHRGLDLIKGRVIRFPFSLSPDKNLKVPQISWNTLLYSENQMENRWENTLLKGLTDRAYMYFVHSYFAQVEDPVYSIAVTQYGDTTYTSVIQRENIMGCQFHPERSGEVGLKILQNFILEPS